MNRHLTQTAISAPALVTAWLYLRRELLYLAWALMEIALLTPFYLTLMPWARLWSPALLAMLLLFLMLIPFNLSRLMTLMEIPMDRQRKWLALGLIIAIVVTIRLLLYSGAGLFNLGWLRTLYDHFVEANNPFWVRDITVFFLVVISWGRGVGLANREAEINAIGLRLRVVGLLVAPLVIWIAIVRLPWDITPFILLFFFASLMAVAMSRAEEIELQRTGSSFPMSPRWMGGIVLAALSVVLLSGLLGWLLGGHGIPTLIVWLQPVWTAVNFAFTAFITTVSYLILPLLLLFERLFWFIRSWLGARWSLPGQVTPQEVPRETPEDYYRLLLDAAASLNERGSTRLLLVLVAVVIVVLVALSMNHLFRRVRGFRDRSNSGLDRTNDRHEELAGDGLGQRLRDQFDRLRRWRAALSVRRIYQQMSRAATACGYPRADTETPYEYLTTLARAWPDHTADVALITTAYVRARYGEIPETGEELAVIQTAWRRLEQNRPQERETDGR